MPYALDLYLYLFVGAVVVAVIAVQLTPLGLLVSIVAALVAACLWVIVGRWLFSKADGL